VSRPGDRFLLAAWLGLLTLQIILLAWSLFGPITPWIGLIVSLSALALLTCSRSVRDEVSSFCAELSLPLCGVIGALAVVTAYAETQPLCNRDVLSYHFDNIHWLSRIGVAPGLGLVQQRFGFLTSWFTIPALFNHGSLTARMAPVANGFAFLLLLGHLALTAWRILRGAGRPADWFVMVALGVGSAFPIFLNDPVSTTGDFPNLLVTIIVAWSALMIYAPSGDSRPDVQRPLRDEQLVPLYLAACLWTIKIVSAPVLGSMGLLYLAHHRFRIKAWAVSGLTAMVVIFPQVVAVTLLTGFPLYPLRGLRLDLPWTLGAHHYLAKTRWGVIPGYVDTDYLSWTWLVNWLRLDVTCVIAFCFFIASVIALIWMLALHKRRWKEVLPCLLIGVTGIALLIVKSPFARFGWAYLTILPATLFYLHASALNRRVDRLPGLFMGSRGAVLMPLAGLAAMVLVLSVYGQTKSEKRIRRAVREGRIELDQPCILLVPPRLPLVVFDDEKGTVRPYDPAPQHPLSEQLRGPRPMFYPLVPRDGIAYRIPEQGPRGGFIHAP